MFKENIVFIGLFCLAFALPAFSQEVTSVPVSSTGSSQMNHDRLEELIGRVDKDFQGEEGLWIFELEGIPIWVVADTNVNRMRIYAPIIKADNIDQEKLLRLMQANFDSALDARYAISRGILWSTYIHPLSPLTDQQFLSGIGQTVNTVISYGNTYSSGVLLFGESDSVELQRDILDRLKRLAETI